MRSSCGCVHSSLHVISRPLALPPITHGVSDLTSQTNVKGTSPAPSTSNTRAMYRAATGPSAAARGMLGSAARREDRRRRSMMLPAGRAPHLSVCVFDQSYGRVRRRVAFIQVSPRPRKDRQGASQPALQGGKPASFLPAHRRAGLHIEGCRVSPHSHPAAVRRKCDYHFASRGRRQPTATHQPARPGTRVALPVGAPGAAAPGGRPRPSIRSAPPRARDRPLPAMACMACGVRQRTGTHGEPTIRVPQATPCRG